MNSTEKYPKYIEWLNAEDMHKDSRFWLSELQFIKHEHQFFSDIINSYISQLTNLKYYDKTKKMVGKIFDLGTKIDLLINAIKAHERNLEVMVDNINQIEEEKAYKDQHRKLKKDLEKHTIIHKNLKVKIFSLIKNILRQDKRLLK